MTTATDLPTDPARVRALVVEAVSQAAELIATPAMAERWDQPSALEGMTVETRRVKKMGWRRRPTRPLSGSAKQVGGGPTAYSPVYAARTAG